MKVKIIEITPKVIKTCGNLYYNSQNQLERIIGKFSNIHIEARSGTVRDQGGNYWDWWETKEKIGDTGFFVIKVILAK